MKWLITRCQRGQILWMILVLLGLVLAGCGNSKAAILGKWEQTGCNSSGQSLTAAYWSEVEFLKGDTVILKNNGSWIYSFPQAGYLNIGGNMGETFKYEVSRDTLRLQQGDGYCDYRRLSGAKSFGIGLTEILLLLPVLLVAGAAGIYVIYRRGNQRKIAPINTASPARPISQAFCMHCGQRVQSGSKFCQHCGKPLS